MQRRVNVCATLACPQCRGELVVTSDEIHEKRVIRCASCGVPVSLGPEDLGMAGLVSGMDEPNEPLAYA